MRIVLPFLLLFIGTQLNAQIRKTFHRDFVIQDSVEHIQFELYGDYETQTWDGADLLIETTVELYNGTDALLSHLIEKTKRYQIEGQRTADVLKIISSTPKRKTLEISKRSVTEIITTLIYIPKEFEAGDATTDWYRKK